MSARKANVSLSALISEGPFFSTNRLFSWAHERVKEATLTHSAISLFPTIDIVPEGERTFHPVIFFTQAAMTVTNVMRTAATTMPEDIAKLILSNDLDFSMDSLPN